MSAPTPLDQIEELDHIRPTPVALGRLKKRADFLAIRTGPRRGSRGFLVQGCKRAGPLNTDPLHTGPLHSGVQALTGHEQTRTSSARVGFTITKKIGNAVARNRIRRRLREALRTASNLVISAQCDYVIIARKAALDMPFQELQRDLTTAFAEITHHLATGEGTKRL